MSKPRHRDNSGESLITVVIAMVVAALLIPGFLLLLRNSHRLATVEPDNDEGLHARAELAALFGSVDPIGACASPSAGTDAAYRDRCFREARWAGASLIEAPDLPAANPPGHGACWLTINPDDPDQRQRRCIVLEGDSDQLECAAAPGPCLRVLSTAQEADGEPVLVDRHGGGLLLVRNWNEDTSSDGVPFLPVQWTEPPTDRLIYTDTEWWCLRWRSPTGSGGGVTPWTGDCPAPADPCERIPSDGTQWNPDFENWTQTEVDNECSPVVPALPIGAQYAAGSAPANGPPRTLGLRVSDVEILVCVASDHADRLQGAPHCAVDRMRFSVGKTFGSLPQALVSVTGAAVAADGLTIQAGSTGTSFEVSLPFEPSADVTVTVNGPPGVSVTPATFTNANWETAQTVTVTIDGDFDRGNENFTFAFTAESSDDAYNGVTLLLPVSVKAPGLEVSPDWTTVTENGASDIEVSLATQPSANVDVAVTISAPSEATVATTALTFTPTNWSTPQTVTVTVTDDNITEPEETFTVTFTTTSTDRDYGGLAPEAQVTVPANDPPGLLVVTDPLTDPDSPSLTVDENGTATFEVSLATAPLFAVTVTVTSDNTTVATVDRSSLTFTPTGWDTAQTVTVTGTDDADISDEATSVTLDPSSVDGDYNILPDATVAVTVTDDDEPALVLSTSSVTVDENGTATLDVILATQPTASVTVSVTSADTAVATVNHAALMFTTTDWNTAQTVTVTGADDTNTTDDSTIIAFTAANGGYDGEMATVAVTADDDDGVDVLTVTCDAADQTITIQWPEQGADSAFVSGSTAGVSISWNAVQGSRLVVATAGLASVQPWEIQYGYEQWDLQWGDLPDTWNGAWSTFWPDGDQLTVYVWPHHDSGDAFPCP